MVGVHEGAAGASGPVDRGAQVERGQAPGRHDRRHGHGRDRQGATLASPPDQSEGGQVGQTQEEVARALDEVRSRGAPAGREPPRGLLCPVEPSQARVQALEEPARPRQELKRRHDEGRPEQEGAPAQAGPIGGEGGLEERQEAEGEDQDPAEEVTPDAVWRRGGEAKHEG